MFAAALIVAAIVADASCSDGATGQARDSRPPQTEQTVTVSRGTRLSVSNFAGEVMIRAWDRDQVRVVARHVPRVKVDVRQTTNAVAITSAHHGMSIDYDISAPAWMPVKVEGEYNFINIEGIQGEVSAETVRGDVMVKGGSGTIVARSIQGEVVVEGARGRVNVSSVNEGIRVSGATGDIVAETTNGHVSLTKITSSSVEVTTVNGHIVFDGTVADKGRYRFTTHNGNITAGVPERSNVSFIVRTYNGEFASSLNVSGPPRSEVRRGRRVTYTLGTGSAEMEMETFGGAIRVGGPRATSAAK